MGESISIRELIARLEELDAATGTEAARLAHDLKKPAVAALAAAYDRGVWQATRPGVGTRAQAAVKLGTTVNFVQYRSSKHSRLLRAPKSKQPRAGQKADGKPSN